MIHHANPKVTVLLAAYNGMKWVDDQVKTILSQRDVDINLVVSVDKSSDGTEDYFLSLAKKDKRVTLLPLGDKFGGAGANFYRLIRDSNFDTADYIAFADQDDLWNLDKLKFSIDTLSEKKCSAFSSNVVAFWEDGSECLINKSQPQRKWDFWFESAGPGCTYVLSNQLANDLKAFCVNNYSELNKFLLHDWFIYAFTRINGYKWFISPESTMYYRQHENNQVGTNNNLKAYLKRIAQLKSGSFRSQVVLLQTLLMKIGGGRKPVVPAKGYCSSLALLSYINAFRRRLRDRLALAFFILLGIF